MGFFADAQNDAVARAERYEAQKIPPRGGGIVRISIRMSGREVRISSSEGGRFSREIGMSGREVRISSREVERFSSVVRMSSREARGR